MTTAAASASARDIHTATEPSSTVPPPRKRRRRTATSGAADDCFTCRKRAIPCDRKRPYCTQCIDIGKECSGYKTTLTWGVGVASRGKLRGLSYPVASKNGETSSSAAAAAAAAAPAAPTQMDGRRRQASVHQKNRSSVDIRDDPLSHSALPSLSPAVVSAPQKQQERLTSRFPVSLAVPHQQWQDSNFPNVDHARDDPLLQRLQTTFPTPFEGQAPPQSATSMASFADSSEFHSPLEYPHTPGSVHFGERLHSINPNTFPQHVVSPGDDLSLHSVPIGSYPEPLSSSIDTIHSIVPSYNGHVSTPHDHVPPHSLIPTSHDHVPHHHHHPPPPPPYSHGLDGFGTTMLALDSMHMGPLEDLHISYDPYGHAQEHYRGEEEEDPDLNSKGLSMIDSRFGNPFFQISPRMQSLFDYYDRQVCPFIVAFDGPENPYRKHILQLAIHNEGLQHAIAALATNNFRMRQQPPPRQTGFVEELADPYGGALSDNSVGEPTHEESYHKQMSIDHLNMQLADVRAAQDDSVLATLLVLCLFHVCDSGFSKFKTQLAGVQKLLTLRGPVGQSDFTRWVEMFFIWFDVMTSTVNDREMQIRPESLDMLDFSANLGALEQFSGCDGRLFKLIARLGRLNLLAQGRPVRRADGLEAPSRHFQRKHPMSDRPLNVHDFENIDGNGWGSPIIPIKQEGSGGNGYELPNLNVPVPDNRHEFWTEWHDVRGRLQAWIMDSRAASTSLPSPQHEAETGQRDLVHINESFRYSALLYTERLGYPLRPSSHPNFQHYVSQALHHITALPVTSCMNKFLLWPLFIAGTECIDPGHRDIVRSRCVEIQKESGFFNNLSSLEVLERVWQDGADQAAVFEMPFGDASANDAAEVKARRRDSEAARTGLYGPAFRWRKAMNRVDGEYIVI